ncbi:MAG: HlyD family efflux transporter periplasmic adaptor subunit, partial [Gemmatimonadota bacterium]|nr:HlyD family efflux transporter periplasmic adaptor subunit [Gemmatimonadota bacterium]
MNKRLRVIVPVVVILAAATWLLARGTTSESDALFASGSVEATTADLGFQQPGRVGQITVSEGTSVAAGQELARLETGELEATLAAAEAQVAAAQARLSELVQGSRPEEIMASEAAARSADRRRENARLDHERARELFEGGAVSRQALDQAETALEVAEAAHDQAAQALVLVREGPRTETVGAQRALVAQARANVARVRATLENARVLAPFDGVITVKHRQAGEIVPAGAPVVTLLDRDDRWVRIYVR